MKRERKKEKNIFTEIDKRNGRFHTVVSIQWPDGVRFRRRSPNLAVARNLLARITAAIAIGTWKALRQELTETPEKPSPPEPDLTIRDLADIYMEKYCKVHNTRPDFKEETLEVIKNILGDVPVKHFRRVDAMHFVEERSKQVSGATVNRGIAVLSNMLTWALNRGLIDTHPMLRFKRLPEPETVLRVMTLEEERRLVEAVMNHDPVVGAYCGILGETGLRMTEGLRLKWDHVSIQRRNLTVAASKNYKTREVPLSDYAIELLKSLPRIVGVPHVFVNMDSRGPVKAPRRPLYQGRKDAKLAWVGFHDFRHFRATQWMMRGIDIRTVQGLLGHRDIQTTMRYAHFAPDHAAKRVIDVQRLEAAELRANRQQTGNQEGLQTGQTC
jgi:integrase